jgi:hypothetical protein
MRLELHAFIDFEDDGLWGVAPAFALVRARLVPIGAGSTRFRGGQSSHGQLYERSGVASNVPIAFGELVVEPQSQENALSEIIAQRQP